VRTDPGRPRRAAPLPSAAVPQAKPIGLVVNPLSGRDVRRLVGRAGNDTQSYPQSCMVLAAGVTELIRPDPPITSPTLVMTCENDSGSTPAMSHAIAAEIPGAETVIAPRLQHMGLVEEPVLFTEALLRFLDRAMG